MLIDDFDHLNAISTWKTIGIDGKGNLSTTLVTETDLILTEGLERYDKNAVATLCNYAVST